MPTGLRRKNLKQKDARELALPSNLVEFLTGVSAAIEAGDEDATIPSDDLLQTDFVYGGLDAEGGDTFSFTYFPEQGVRQKWEFSLTAEELRRIREGSLTSLTMWCCRTPGCRSAFRGAEYGCFYCDWDEPTANGEE